MRPVLYLAKNRRSRGVHEQFLLGRKLSEQARQAKLFIISEPISTAEVIHAAHPAQGAAFHFCNVDMLAHGLSLSIGG
ncbi:hypothetical protein SAMN03159406_01249 [Rhizobium sp. NFR03]|nr:hypothetical protein SAMN03159406_01249 [Rhizobium sp. NFR03]